MHARFRSLTLLAVALAACASQPALVAAQPVQGDSSPPVAGALPPTVVRAVQPLVRSDSIFATLHPAEARQFDSLAKLPPTRANMRALHIYDRRLASMERRLTARRDSAHRNLLADRAPVADLPTLALAPSPSWRSRSAWALLGYGAGLVDYDRGGYVDSWRYQHDKGMHAASSIAVAYVTRDVPSCLAAGAALELGQRRGGSGFASKYDFGYDAGGCVAGYALRRWVAPHVSRLLALR
jgi:hypothetical protein